MPVDYQQIDTVNARLTVRVPRSEYEPKYRSALINYRKKADFKGFRKGKTPVAYLQKLFGRDVLAETVSKLITSGVNDYIEVHEINLIGRPLPATEQQPLDFDPGALPDEYAYMFDIGLAPQFDVQGLDHEVEWIDVPVTQDEIDAEWLRLRKDHGTFVEGETIDIDSRIHCEFRELDNFHIKEDGRKCLKEILIKSIRPEIAAQLTGQEVGFTFRFDPDHILVSGTAETFARRYMDLNDEDEPLMEMCEAEVRKVEDLVPAEVSQELIEKVIRSDQITTEDQALEQIGKVMKSHRDRLSDRLMHGEMRRTLIANNQVELPDAFLERLFKAMREEDQETAGGEEVHTGHDEAYDPVEHRAEVLWVHIRQKLIDRFAVKVSEDELKSAVINYVVHQYRGFISPDNPYMQKLIENAFENKDLVSEIYSATMTNKLFVALSAHMPVQRRPGTKEEVLERINALDEGN